MSIENNLKRIADALETIANAMNKTPCDDCGNMDGYRTPAPTTLDIPEPATPAPIQEAPAPIITNNTPAPGQPSQTATPVAPAPAPAPAQGAIVMSPEELNNVLVAEFKRIGDRGPIDAAMNAMGVSSVNELPAERQAELIANIKAIPGQA